MEPRAAQEISRTQGRATQAATATKPLEREIWKLRGRWISLNEDGEASALLDFEEAKKVKLLFWISQTRRIKKAENRGYEYPALYREVRRLPESAVAKVSDRAVSHHSALPSVVASPRELPLSHMTDALFDWVGVEKKCRPTNSGVRTVARYIERRLGEIADEPPRWTRISVAQRSKTSPLLFVYIAVTLAHR